MSWLNQLSLKAKVMVPIGILAVLLIVQLFLTNQSLSKLEENTQTFNQLWVPVLSGLLKADTDLHQMKIAEQQAIEAGNNNQDFSEFKAEFDKNYQQVVERVNIYTDISSSVDGILVDEARILLSDLSAWQRTSSGWPNIRPIGF